MSDTQQWCSAKTKGLTSTQHSKGQNILVWSRKLCQSILHLSGPGTKIFHLGNLASSSKWFFASSGTSALQCAVLTLLTTHPLSYFIPSEWPTSQNWNPHVAGDVGREKERQRKVLLWFTVEFLTQQACVRSVECSPEWLITKFWCVNSEGRS